MLELLSVQDYHRIPWKNGNGITEDVLLLPKGASHEDFEIRVSCASIVDESRFSAFPDIDRTITRLGSNQLVLCFADGSETVLDYLTPYSFDSALTPTSRLPAGASRVLNVMTRRGLWNAHVSVIRNTTSQRLDVPRNGLVLAHAALGWCSLNGCRAEADQTLVTRAEKQVELAVADGGACLVATISPTGGS